MPETPIDWIQSMRSFGQRDAGAEHRHVLREFELRQGARRTGASDAAGTGWRRMRLRGISTVEDTNALCVLLHGRLQRASDIMKRPARP